MNQKKEIKQALELILGGPIVLSDHSEEEKLKEEFIKLIELYESVWNRDNKLEDELNVDFTGYNNDYYKVIESLINFCFEGGAAEAIIFYIYMRHNDDGTLNTYLDKHDREHQFETPEDLWEFLLDWADQIMRQ